MKRQRKQKKGEFETETILKILFMLLLLAGLAYFSYLMITYGGSIWDSIKAFLWGR